MLVDSGMDAKIGRDVGVNMVAMDLMARLVLRSEAFTGRCATVRQ